MSFSHGAACNFVPLMARLVLGGAFIFTGWAKMQTDTFTGQDAETIRRIQAGVSDSSESSALDGSPGEWTIVHASMRQDDGTQAPPEPAGGGAGGERIGGDSGQDDAARSGGAVDTPKLEGTQPPGGPAIIEPIDAKGLYGVAITIDKAGIKQYQIPLAWAAALTELIGGALILVGLFARLWGLALAGVMGVAFYSTTWQGLTAAESYMAYFDSHTNFFSLITQASLFVLAFGVFLTGAGAVSVDRLLFKSDREENPADVDLT